MKTLTILFLFIASIGYGQRIDAMTAASAADGTEIFHVYQGGNSRKMSVNQVKTFVDASYWNVDAGTIMTALGSNIKATGVALPLRDASAVVAIADGQIRIVATEIRTAQTITGVSFVQRVQGAYTADNYNGVGLYSYNSGALTLVASSTDDGDLWKQTANAYTQKAFSSPYAAAAGTYFIAILYNTSAQSTAPQVSGLSANNAIAYSGDLSGVSMSMLLSSQNTLPASSNVSSFAAANNFPWCALY
jgi:hypothetical protein